MKKTVVSGAGSNTADRGQGSTIVDLILFGNSANMKKGMSLTQSFQNTVSSGLGTVS